MYVKDTQSLSATVFPQNATEQTVYFSSSNTSIAKVDRAGNVTAVSRGNCKIYAYCDGLTVSYSLEVRVKTESINVVSKFIVLKPDQQKNLEASVTPSDAVSELTYKSSNENIVSVDKNGNIVANGLGSTSIIISNNDQTISVSVIVNTDGEQKNDSFDESDSLTYRDDFEGELEKKIKDSVESTVVVSNVKVISVAALTQLYGKEKTLIVEFEKYDFIINGMDLVNIENVLNAELDLNSTESFTEVITHSKTNLPGKIKIRLKDCTNNYQYLYMYNENNENYTRLNNLTNNEFIISSTGKYYLTNKKLDGFRINYTFIAAIIVIILVLCVIYIFSKKKYWFW